MLLLRAPGGRDASVNALAGLVPVFPEKRAGNTVSYKGGEKEGKQIA
jgi:hypothetical protein